MIWGIFGHPSQACRPCHPGRSGQPRRSAWQVAALCAWVSVAWLTLAGAQAWAEPVRFSILAPQAKVVYLAGEMTDWDTGKRAMTRQNNGAWSIELDLAPGQWIYKFVVDGLWTNDPVAGRSDADGRGGQHSFVFVGEGPWKPRPDVPQGTVATFEVPSAALKRSMKTHVYWPPGANHSKPLPMLVLLHGGDMDADQWFKTGHIHTYMDNLIADKKIAPFVIVMPSSAHNDYSAESQTHVVQELPQWFERTFGWQPEAAKTAVAGMSWGGFGAVALPLRNPGRYHYGFAMSGYFPKESLPELKIPAHCTTRFSLVTGATDRVTATGRAWVAAQDLTPALFTYREDPGAHTWHFFSNHTAEMLQTVATQF